MPPAEGLVMASNATEPAAKRVKWMIEVSSPDKVTRKINPGSSDDWRKGGLRNVNGYALKNEILTDVTFKVGQEAKEIHAHRLILALASPVFEAMFYGGLAEKGNVVSIPDVTPEGFQGLLTYIYTESCTFESAKEAFETLLAADKYCFFGLKRECERFVSTYHLSPENVWLFLDYSLLLSLKDITEKSLHFLSSHTRMSILTRAFLDASKEAILQILALDIVDVSEIFLLQHIVYWSEGQTTDDVMIAEIVHSLLKHIRFGSIDPDEFCAFLENNGKFINDSDALEILKHLTKPVAHSLPAWCCSKSLRTVRIVYDPDYPDDRVKIEDQSKIRFSYYLNELLNRSRSRRTRRRSGMRMCTVLTINNATSSESESSSGS